MSFDRRISIVTSVFIRFDVVEILIVPCLLSCLDLLVVWSLSLLLLLGTLGNAGINLSLSLVGRWNLMDLFKSI